jgi:hypothetical protein
MKKKRMETSKKLLWISYIIAITLTVIVVICSFMNIECSNITSIIPYSYGEVAAVNVFYLTMNKRLNAPKVLMGIYNDLPDNLKEQIDINSLLSNIMN